jgi:small-conductance mechanosensitive channel
MKKKYLLGFTLLIVIGLFGTSIIGNFSSAQDIPITFEKFMDDFDDANINFSSYNDGDVVSIMDTIIEIQFDSSTQKTNIWFESEGAMEDISKFLTVIGDITNQYKEGEKIVVNIFIYESPPGSGIEKFTSSEEEIKHYEKVEEPDEEKHGIDILGFHFEFPEPLEILDNNLGRFIIQFLLWLLIAAIVLLILDPVIKKATEKTETKIDDIILHIIRRPIMILIILYGIVVSLAELELPNEFMYWINGAYSIGFFLMMIWIGFKVFQGVLLQLGHTLAKRTKSHVDKILVPAIQKLGTVVIAFIALSAILGYLHIDLTLFVAGGVVVSMVIAFAAQDTLSNFFAGMFLILEPKFKEEDMIEFEGNTYIVKKIGMRTTQLYDLFKHIFVVMPNNKLANEKLIIITEPDRRIKDSCEIGVAYGSDPQKIQDILMEITTKHPDVISDDPNREPFTRFTNFGDSSIDFKVGFWVKDLDDRFRVKSELNQEIYYRLAKEGIEIPFPQRDLNIKYEENKSDPGKENPVKKLVRKRKIKK